MNRLLAFIHWLFFEPSKRRRELERNRDRRRRHHLFKWSNAGRCGIPGKFGYFGKRK
jgi:hypothetical protein